jgi:hypothetical protein
MQVYAVSRLRKSGEIGNEHPDLLFINGGVGANV